MASINLQGEADENGQPPSSAQAIFDKRIGFVGRPRRMARSHSLKRNHRGALLACSRLLFAGFTQWLRRR